MEWLMVVSPIALQGSFFGVGPGIGIGSGPASSMARSALTTLFALSAGSLAVAQRADAAFALGVRPRAIQDRADGLLLELMKLGRRLAEQRSDAKRHTLQLQLSATIRRLALCELSALIDPEASFVTRLREGSEAGWRHSRVQDWPFLLRIRAASSRFVSDDVVARMAGRWLEEQSERARVFNETMRAATFVEMARLTPDDWIESLAYSGPAMDPPLPASLRVEAAASLLRGTVLTKAQRARAIEGLATVLVRTEWPLDAYVGARRLREIAYQSTVHLAAAQTLLRLHATGAARINASAVILVAAERGFPALGFDSAHWAATGPVVQPAQRVMLLQALEFRPDASELGIVRALEACLGSTHPIVQREALITLLRVRGSLSIESKKRLLPKVEGVAVHSPLVRILAQSLSEKGKE